MPKKIVKEEPETIAQWLQRLRREKGITQAEIAELLGISQSIASDYERGELRHQEALLRTIDVFLSKARSA